MTINPLNKQNGTSHAPTQEQEQKLNSMLAALWVRSRHTVVERAELLQVAANLWVKNSLDEPTRMRAVDSAHKLAGVLGTFGLPRGTDLAREAEVLFGQVANTGREEVERLQELMSELTHLIEVGPLGRT